MDLSHTDFFCRRMGLFLAVSKKRHFYLTSGKEDDLKRKKVPFPGPELTQ
jgi:hypothetical protein